MQAIEFIKPDSLDDVLNLLLDADENTQLVAGGTDVIPGIRQGSSRFKDTLKIIDIHDLSELNQITMDKSQIRIGAASTFSSIIDNEDLIKTVPVLIDAAKRIGSLQIRNRATIAGNFVNNAPCADSVPALLVYNARIKIVSSTGSRVIGLEEFLQKPYKTALKKDELVSEIQIPNNTQNYMGVFHKLGRRRGVAVSRISVAILMHLSNNSISDIRIASGAITPIGIRFPELEKSLKNNIPTPELFKRFAQQLGEGILKITGVRWSTPYKLPVLQKLFFQLLCELTGISND